MPRCHRGEGSNGGHLPFRLCCIRSACQVYQNEPNAHWNYSGHWQGLWIQRETHSPHVGKSWPSQSYPRPIREKEANDLEDSSEGDSDDEEQQLFDLGDCEHAKNHMHIKLEEEDRNAIMQRGYVLYAKPQIGKTGTFLAILQMCRNEIAPKATQSDTLRKALASIERSWSQIDGPTFKKTVTREQWLRYHSLVSSLSTDGQKLAFQNAAKIVAQ
jgi:hypothetical protein